MGKSCGFFEWADEDGNSASTRPRFDNSQRGSNASGRGRGNGAPKITGQKRRKCGLCGDEGIRNVLLQFFSI